MPCDYRTKAKTQFPLPEYPQEEKFEDAIQYEMAVTQFGVDHVHILAQHNEWVDHEQIMDITHTSEAAHLQVEADKWWWEVEEVKAHQASEGEKCPKKWGHADTAGSSIVVASSSGSQKGWKVCVYCTKWGKFSIFLFPFSRVDSS